MTHQQIMNKINELEDKITDAKLELAAIDGDDAAAASIALQAANSKIVQAEDEFNLEMSSIEEGAKKVFEEVMGVELS